MSTIREVVNRIHSITSTQQITRAMKMVAAAKLNKVQQHVLQMRPYAEKLVSVLDNVVASTDQQLAQRYTEERKIEEKVLIVVMSSDRGLCGSFNTNVLRKAREYIHEVYNLDPAQVDLLPIGKKALNFFEKEDFNLITEYVALSQYLNFEHVSQVASFIIEAFLNRIYDHVTLVYNEFKSAATQVPKVEQFLPLLRTTGDEPKQEAQIDYIYEPSKAALMEELVPRSLKIQFYKALLESNASEHGARMTTMSKATDNADELLKGLRLTYNRTRQAVITREISEIVAGAEALSH